MPVEGSGNRPASPCPVLHPESRGGSHLDLCPPAEVLVSTPDLHLPIPCQQVLNSGPSGMSAGF